MLLKMQDKVETYTVENKEEMKMVALFVWFCR